MNPDRDKPLSFSWCAGGDWLSSLRLPSEPKRFEQARASILLDAIIEATGGGRWISYSRNKNFYTGQERYHGSTYAYSTVPKAVDQLTEMGLIEHRKSRAHVDRGRQSTFRASPLLIDAVTLPAFTHDCRETIIFKDNLKRLVNYQDTERTRKMRRSLIAFNEALETADVTLKVGQQDGPFIRFDSGSIVNTSQKNLYRVFNNAWNAGGRFYGHWMQNVPSTHRNSILIDGQATTEPDHSQIHPTLLYAIIGTALDDDAYTLDAWPRSMVKVAFNVIINANSYTSALGAVANKVQSFIGSRDVQQAAKLIADLKVRHRPIERFFHTGIGLHLQRIDSDMAAVVMHELIGQNIITLPVHDSFRVQKQHEQATLEAMEKALFKGKKTAQKCYA